MKTFSFQKRHFQIDCIPGAFNSRAFSLACREAPNDNDARAASLEIALIKKGPRENVNKRIQKFIHCARRGLHRVVSPKENEPRMNVKTGKSSLEKGPPGPHFLSVL